MPSRSIGFLIGLSPSRLLKILFVNALVLLVLMMLLESVMDYVSFRRNDVGKEKYEIEYVRRLPPPFSDRIQEADSFQKRVDATLRRNFRLVTNKDGLILGPDQYGETRTLSTCDILFMGGSTTECRFVDDSLRFPYRTSVLLSKALGREVVALSASYSGNNTFHSISNLVHTGLSYKPRMVVLMHNINDLAVLCRNGSYFNPPGVHRFLTKRKTKERHSFADHFISIHFPNLSAAISGLSYRLGIARSSPSSRQDEFRGYRSTHVEQSVIMDEYVKALRTFHGICEANGISLVLMTQANRLDGGNRDSIDIFLEHEGRMELKSHITTYHRINQTIRDYAKKNALTCIDLDRGIPHNGTYIYDQVHLNSAGSTLASRLIFDGLMQRGSLLEGVGN